MIANNAHEVLSSFSLEKQSELKVRSVSYKNDFVFRWHIGTEFE